MQLLTYTTLYPASVRPQHGVFVETRLRHLLASGEIEGRVIAPVPWFPFRQPCFGSYATHARVPRCELRHGIEVTYPRYPLIPKIGMTVAPALLAAASLPSVRRMLAEFPFQLIDAHYFYPDGVAAAIIAARLGRPFVVTARGTDINLIPRFRAARQMIRWAAGRASAIITVCQALKEELVRLGVAAEKITVLRNGVDLDRFRPVDRQAARKRLGLEGMALISVGHLVERKGHHLVIEALPGLPELSLLVIGAGPEESALRKLAEQTGVAHRVRFLGAIPQETLAEYYSAADALVLASSREGWANVLLEAMACGTPVVATRSWGTPEVVQSREAGVMMAERTPQALIEAVNVLRAGMPDRAMTRRYAERFGWEPTTQGQKAIFARVLAGPARSSLTARDPAG